ncbi:cytochrome ubiquinol oxidase subunit I [bacterium]|nr:cytochrome ubiquinol oxidase subunit I [bacterium]
MNYPVWELAMGAGVLMALVSVLHVFVSHFAVGGGLWLVLTEARADRRGDADLRAHVRAQSKVFLLVTLVFGAITGVGIWSTAALISPHGIMALIRAYVWGWAMEWVFFVVEIAAALVYWYGWEKLDARTHRIVGWIYFIAAFMSLVIINGIVTFMLTPGGWLETKEFWTGFFNPTYWPSLVLRTGASLAMAGLFTLLTASFLKKGATRTWATRWSGGWVLAGFGITLLTSFWYDAALAGAMDAVAGTLGLPGWNELTTGALPVLPQVLWYFKLGLVAAMALSLWPLLAPSLWNPAGGVLIFLAGLLAFFGGEWAREAARKPFTIYGYMYSTGVLLADEPALAETGMEASTRWLNPASDTPEARGKDLFRAWCQPCHTMDSYNGLRPFLARWSEEQTAEMLPRLQHMRAQMPGWPAGDRAVADLAAYLRGEGAKGDASFPADPDAAGRLAWDLHCGLCHTVDGYRELRSSLEGMDRGELEELVDGVADLMEEMPPYLGDDVAREHLLNYLETVATPAATEGSES